METIEIPGHVKRNARYYLFGIVILGLIFRLLIINIPDIKFTSWKEIDYIEISKNYVLNNHNFIKPTITWPAEPPNVTAMELPVVPYITSFLYRFFGVNDYSTRMLSLVAGILLIIFIYKLVNYEYKDILAALISAFLIAILPLKEFNTRTLFSEPVLILLSVMTLYYFLRFLNEGKNKFIAGALVSYTFCISLKPDTLVLLLPLTWLIFRKYKFDWKKYGRFFLLFLPVLVIPVIWYTYTYYLAKNSIDVFGVFLGHNKFQIITMLSKQEWYAKILMNVVNLTGGKIGFSIFLVGIILSFIYKKNGLFIFYLLSILSFFIIVAEGNYDTSYRQLTILPSAVYFISFGLVSLLALVSKLIIKVFPFLQKYNFNFKLGFIGFILIVFGAINLRLILKFKLYAADPAAWNVANHLKKFSNSSTKIITAGEYTIHKGGYDLSPILFYYAGLKGWSLQPSKYNLEKVKELIKKGAGLFVARDIEQEMAVEIFVEQLKKEYEVLDQGPNGEFIIIKLR